MLRNTFDTKTTKLFLLKKSKQNKQTKIAKTAKKITKAGALLQLKYQAIILFEHANVDLIL